MLQTLMRDFDLEVRMITRSRRRQDVYVLYLKEGEQIVDLLNVMQAYTALMDLENIRIEKEMRNQINRSVNCEAANLQKVVKAALKQVEDIEYLIRCSGWRLCLLRLQKWRASVWIIRMRAFRNSANSWIRPWGAPE